MKNAFLSILLLFTIASCDPPELQTGTLKGTVGLYSGNCMPVIGTPPCTQAPISTTIAITRPCESFNMELLIDSVVSKADGSFQINLKPGKYSLFLRDGNQFVCDYWNSDGVSTQCHPIEIKLDSTLIVNANINHAVW